MLSLPFSLSLGFGESLPDTVARTSRVNAKRPDRSVGGEIITISFKAPHEVKEVRLTAFSKSGMAKVLVRKAQASVTNTVGGQDQVSTIDVAELYSFDQKSRGSYGRHNETGYIMLSANNWVETNLNKPNVNSISLRVEGYSHNDATLLVELASPEGFNYYDFTVTREPAHIYDPIGDGTYPPPRGGPSGRGSYYAWYKGNDGWGRCYEWTTGGDVLNGGNPVSNYLCEAVAPSHYEWGRSNNGYTRCYQVTPNGYYLHEGSPVSDYLCK
jgi:hypothetical protein